MALEVELDGKWHHIKWVPAERAQQTLKWFQDGHGGKYNYRLRPTEGTGL